MLLLPQIFRKRTAKIETILDEANSGVKIFRSYSNIWLGALCTLYDLQLFRPVWSIIGISDKVFSPTLIHRHEGAYFMVFCEYVHKYAVIAVYNISFMIFRTNENFITYPISS